MKEHWAGSVAYDNDRDEWEDYVLLAMSEKELVTDMKEFMATRRNSEVFFAAHVVDGKEYDITGVIREQIGDE